MDEGKMRGILVRRRGGSPQEIMTYGQAKRKWERFFPTSKAKTKTGNSKSDQDK